MIEKRSYPNSEPKVAQRGDLLAVTVPRPITDTISDTRCMGVADFAHHIATGIRTVENLLAQRLIVGIRKGRSLQLDCAECERRLFEHTISQPLNSMPKSQYMQIEHSSNAPYTTFNGLSKRYAVSLKTVKKWKKMGILVFIQVRRVVRFHVPGCDAALQKYGYL